MKVGTTFVLSEGFFAMLSVGMRGVGSCFGEGAAKVLRLPRIPVDLCGVDEVYRAFLQESPKRGRVCCRVAGISRSGMTN
jgi:hypothetical protein